MKKLTRFTLAAAIFAMVCGLFTAPAFAQGNTQTSLTFADTASGTTLASYVIPIGDGHPSVTYVNATSDKAGSVLQFYKATSGSHTLAIATNASQAVVWVPDGTKYSANDVVVLRHKLSTGDIYERLVVSSATSTNLTMTGNLSTAVLVGDQLWKMTKYGTIPVGAATKEVASSVAYGLYNAPGGRPVLLDLDGTSACKINLITGRYLP